MHVRKTKLKTEELKISNKTFHKRKQNTFFFLKANVQLFSFERSCFCEVSLLISCVDFLSVYCYAESFFHLTLWQNYLRETVRITLVNF